MSDRGINLIPLSSRGDDGKCATEETPEVLSRTEREFVAKNINYNYKNWKKPAPFQNLTKQVEIKDNDPEAHGAYKLRNGIIYGSLGTPHKAAAIIGIVNILKETGDLPSAIYMTDRKKTIEEILEDLKNTDLGVPLYLLQYVHPKAFLTPEDLMEFYIHRLGEVKFKEYENEFKTAFDS
jgi:hypothetical protein